MAAAKQLQKFGLLDPNKRCCAVYVMASESHPEKFRIGHYSTSGKARLNQVKGGTGDCWKIIGGIEFESKKKAAAVEAIAHHLQEKKIRYINTSSGARVEIFVCTKKACKQAIQDAANLLGQLGLTRLKFRSTRTNQCAEISGELLPGGYMPYESDEGLQFKQHSPNV